MSVNNQCWRRCGAKGTLLHGELEWAWVEPVWKRLWRFPKELKVEVAYGSAVRLPGIPPDFRSQRGGPAPDVLIPVGTTVDEAEKTLLMKTLERTNQNKTRAAEILGISL